MANKVKCYWDERWMLIEAKAATKTKDYYFSDYGRLKSIDKSTENESLLNGSRTIQNFLQINLKLKDNIRQGFYVHKLVGGAFVDKQREDQKFLIHLDRDNFNNRFKNLRWMNQREMTDFQIENGVYHHENRKRSVNYKMNPARVKLLKIRLKEGKTKKKILAKSFGITVEQLRKIEKGIDWKYVTIDD